MSSQQSELINKIGSLSDRDLIRMLNAPKDYTPEAFEIAQKESHKRGGIEILKLNVSSEIQARMKAEVEAEIVTDGKLKEIKEIKEDKTKSTIIEDDHFIAKTKIRELSQRSFLYWFLSLIFVVTAKLSSNIFLIIITLRAGLGKLDRCISGKAAL